MDTNNENIENLDDNVESLSPNPAPTETVSQEPEPVPAATTESLDPINLNDMVSPTNLQTTNINSFGQEGISLNDINQNPKPSTLETPIKSSEYNNIGMVPPAPAKPEEEKKPEKPKKKMKILSIIIAIILIGGIGFGVYWYLGLGNKVGGLSLKTVKVQLNDTISTNVNDYITSGKPDSSCVTNFDDVNTSTVGDYTYKVICNKKTYTGTIKVVDETPPVIVLNNLIISVNNTVAIDDFVKECADSDCSYEFVDEETLKTNIATPGDYEVEIKVSDDNNNSKVVKAFLIVLESPINRRLVCESKEIEESAGNYSYMIDDTVPIAVINSQLLNAGKILREYKVTYKNVEDYNSAKESIKDGIIEASFAKGLANYDDIKKQIVISEIKTKEELTSEFKEYPDSYSDLRNKYENDEREFECNITFNNN